MLNVLLAMLILTCFCLFYVGFILAPLFIVILGYALFSWGGR